jgi:hypothetical protein
VRSMRTATAGGRLHLGTGGRLRRNSQAHQIGLAPGDDAPRGAARDIVTTRNDGLPGSGQTAI